MASESRGRMKPWLKIGFLSLIVCSCVFPCAAQCGFAIVPAAETRWYKSDGWTIPGLSDAKGFAAIHRTLDGMSKDWVLPEGITVSWVAHDQGYHVQFPDAFFDDNGSRKRMLPRKFLLYQMLRWQMNGTTYAYSYVLGPQDVACTASVDIIDDRGDGKFCLMTSPGHTTPIPARNDPVPPPLPAWLQKPKA
jgi:hypothetical protein